MEKPENYISCCGFYCKTCKVYKTSYCKGCKLGYETNKRDINKAKCNIKLCCYKDKQLITCAECKNFEDCEVVKARFKPGTYENKKCIEQLNFIKKNGCASFIEIANSWKNHYGRLK